jgi:hypothetical protein
MGWPRRNDEMRLYADKKEKGAYFMVFPDQEGSRGYDAIANVYPGPEPSLVGTSISRNYLARTWAKRVSWTDLSQEWKDAFREYLSGGEDEPFNPALIRGLWRIAEQPHNPEQYLQGSLAGEGTGVVRYPAARE